jgi:hypothetical protein
MSDHETLRKAAERIERRMLPLLDAQFRTDSHWMRREGNRSEEDAAETAAVFAQALASNRHDHAALVVALDALRACLAGADALRRTCGTWQPIETATKTGTAFVGLTWNNETCAVYWSPTHECYRYAGDGWRSGDAPRLTHWMPLPDAPKETDRG